MASEHLEMLETGALKPAFLRRELSDLYRRLAQCMAQRDQLERSASEAMRKEHEAWLARLAKIASFQQTLESAVAMGESGGESPDQQTNLRQVLGQFISLLEEQKLRVEVPVGPYDDALAGRADVHDVVSGDVAGPTVRFAHRPIVEFEDRIIQRGLISKLVPRVADATPENC